MALCLYFTFLLIIFVPISIIVNVFCIIVIILSIDAISYYFSVKEFVSLNTNGETWYKFVWNYSWYIFKETLLIIILTILLIIIDALLLSGLIIIDIIYYVPIILCQPVVWPLVESIRIYHSIKKIIIGHYNGIKKHNNKELKVKTFNNNKKYNENDILKTAGLSENQNDIPLSEHKEYSIDEYDLQNQHDNNNNNNINNKSIYINSKNNSSSIFSIKEILNDEKKIIPTTFFDEISLKNIILKLWKYKLKNIFIMSTKWNISIFTMYILIFYDKIDSEYEGMRYLWWHKKKTIDRPNFN